MNGIRRLIFRHEESLTATIRCLFLVNAALIVSGLSAILGMKTWIEIPWLFVIWSIHELLLRSEANSKTSLIGMLTVAVSFLRYFASPLIVFYFFPGLWSRITTASPIHILWIAPIVFIPLFIGGYLIIGSAVLQRHEEKKLSELPRPPEPKSK